MKSYNQQQAEKRNNILYNSISNAYAKPTDRIDHNQDQRLDEYKDMRDKIRAYGTRPDLDKIAEIKRHNLAIHRQLDSIYSSKWPLVGSSLSTVTGNTGNTIDIRRRTSKARPQSAMVLPRVGADAHPQSVYKFRKDQNFHGPDLKEQEERKRNHAHTVYKENVLQLEKIHGVQSDQSHALIPSELSMTVQDVNEKPVQTFQNEEESDIVHTARPMDTARGKGLVGKARYMTAPSTSIDTYVYYTKEQQRKGARQRTEQDIAERKEKGRQGLARCVQRQERMLEARRLRQEHAAEMQAIHKEQNDQFLQPQVQADTEPVSKHRVDNSIPSVSSGYLHHNSEETQTDSTMNNNDPGNFYHSTSSMKSQSKSQLSSSDQRNVFGLGMEQMDVLLQATSLGYNFHNEIRKHGVDHFISMQKEIFESDDEDLDAKNALPRFMSPTKQPRKDTSNSSTNTNNSTNTTNSTNTNNSNTNTDISSYVETPAKKTQRPATAPPLHVHTTQQQPQHRRQHKLRQAKRKDGLTDKIEENDDDDEKEDLSNNSHNSNNSKNSKNNNNSPIIPKLPLSTFLNTPGPNSPYKVHKHNRYVKAEPRPKSAMLERFYVYSFDTKQEHQKIQFDDNLGMIKLSLHHNEETKQKLKQEAEKYKKMMQRKEGRASTCGIKKEALKYHNKAPGPRPVSAVPNIRLQQMEQRRCVSVKPMKVTAKADQV